MFGNKKIDNIFGDGSSGSESEAPNKKQRIILAVLSTLFLVVFIGAFWDIYGRNLFCNCDCGSGLQTQDNLAPPPRPEDGAATSTVTNSSNPLTEQNDQKQSGQVKADSNVDMSLYSQCLENTKDVQASKDCCDCLTGDASVHKACRDAAATYDFSKNTVFKTFEIPSALGRDGDYSAFTASGNQQQCKQACESASSGLACGDYQYCRTACNSLPQ